MPEGRHIWEREGEKDNVSYLLEMVKHQNNLYGVLAAVLAGAVLSFPLGLGVAAVPLLLFAAGEAIAALFIPSSPVFRDKVDRRKRRDRRERTRAHLIDEIRRREHEDSSNGRTYSRMLDRLGSLREMVQRGNVALTERDLERLDDATVDYLGLWVANLVMTERRRTVNVRDLEHRLQAIDAQLESTASGAEARKLEKARADLLRIKERHDSLWARETAVDAGMLSMADGFEEVYQRVMTNPNSSDASTHINAAVDRMRMEEELDSAVDTELDDLLRKRRAGAMQRA